MSKRKRRVAYPERILECEHCEHSGYGLKWDEVGCCHPDRLGKIKFVKRDKIDDTCPLRTEIEVVDD